ncbi:stress responsive A/B barrel domain-containing protein [Bombardia bombarda]|uniref:Stress responsive A/B barrel domain-containing protein n=1 Tax=Bombardia bombarda TaxID=252184 RepID=A0AA40CH90_9PEZI|nr:stress responsive A/B barrel domain-containing protein [Bombardia bombarda]
MAPPLSVTVKPGVVRVVAIVAFILGLLFIFDPIGLASLSPTSLSSTKGGLGADYQAGGSGSITHIVMFEFKKDASPKAIETACTKMLALKETCREPRTLTPYIRKITGGRDNSPEKLQNGLTHAFVVEFESAAERDYYVEMDPAHQDFKRDIKDIVEKATVLDFTNGVFA